MVEFAIDKSYSANLLNKRATFIEETQTRKGVHLTMITANGLKNNSYSNMIQSEVVMDDSFK